MILSISGMRRSFSSSVRLLFFVLILLLGVSFCGCIEQYSGEPQQPVSLQSGESLQPGEGLSVPASTTVPTVVLEQESQQGYIARSFGLVPYGVPPDYHITYIDSSAKRDKSGAVYIQGRLKNEGPANLNYLHVTYHLFDVNGNVLGNVDATLEYLPAGATWRYTTSSYPTDYYQYYQLAGIVAQ